MGDLAVRTTHVLPWEGIVEMVGDAERLRDRLTEIATRVDRERLDTRTRAAFETAERYALGELPAPDPYGRPTA